MCVVDDALTFSGDNPEAPIDVAPAGVRRNLDPPQFLAAVEIQHDDLGCNVLASLPPCVDLLGTAATWCSRVVRRVRVERIGSVSVGDLGAVGRSYNRMLWMTGFGEKGGVPFQT